MSSPVGPPISQQPQQQQAWDAPANAPRFQTLKFLGKGGQGFVQLAYDNLHKKRVAIKYIDRGWSRGFYKYVLRETLNHQQLSLCQHPHIVEFHEVFLTPSYLAVVMEYVNGTNLQHYLEAAGGKLPEDVARFIFQQLVIAVDFCHRKGKVNRDIKLANILLQEGHLPLVKLCDFGFSKDKFDDSEPQTQIGTALFTAPEIFTNVPGQVYDAEAADVWSCGVVLFVMLFGCHPFLSVEDTQMRKHAQVMKLIENAVRGQVQVPPGAAELHPQALDLVRRILVSSPGQRCKLPAVMSHPWFQDKLPPGALLLNAAYLAMEQPAGNLRQTPEEVHSIITAALSAGAGPVLEEKSECNSAGPGVPANMMVCAGGPGADAAMQSDSSHIYQQGQGGQGGGMGMGYSPGGGSPPGGSGPVQVGAAGMGMGPGQGMSNGAQGASMQQQQMQAMSMGAMPGRPPSMSGTIGGVGPTGRPLSGGISTATGGMNTSMSGGAVSSGGGPPSRAVSGGLQSAMSGGLGGGGMGMGQGAQPTHSFPGRGHGGMGGMGQGQPGGGMLEVAGPMMTLPLAPQHPAHSMGHSMGQSPSAPAALAAGHSAQAMQGTQGGGASTMMQHAQQRQMSDGAMVPDRGAGRPPGGGGNPMDAGGCILYDSSLLYTLDLSGHGMAE